LTRFPDTLSPSSLPIALISLSLDILPFATSSILHSICHVHRHFIFLQFLFSNL
jgi:hypothetical protein